MNTNNLSNHFIMQILETKFLLHDVLALMQVVNNVNGVKNRTY